jgi:diamine N-acetyltransferase
MYIAPQYRGQGIGREAVRLLEEYAFGFLHMRIIYAIISTSNTACSELYRQVGYTPSSVLPSWTLEADAVLWFKQAS